MATGLQAAGAVAISIGAGLIFIPAGIIIGGVFAVAFGIALERNAR
jgi:hypothetical protein